MKYNPEICGKISAEDEKAVFDGRSEFMLHFAKAFTFGRTERVSRASDKRTFRTVVYFIIRKENARCKACPRCFIQSVGEPHKCGNYNAATEAFCNSFSKREFFCAFGHAHTSLLLVFAILRKMPIHIKYTTHPPEKTIAQTIKF